MKTLKVIHIRNNKKKKSKEKDLNDDKELIN